MNSALRSHGWLSITTALIIAGVIAGILVRLPFLEKAIANGVLSSLLAIGMLVITLYFSIEQLPELMELESPFRLAILVVMILALGIGISWGSTYMSVRKYLRIKTDLLYT